MDDRDLRGIRRRVLAEISRPWDRTVPPIRAGEPRGGRSGPLAGGEALPESRHGPDGAETRSGDGVAIMAVAVDNTCMCADPAGERGGGRGHRLVIWGARPPSSRPPGPLTIRYRLTDRSDAYSGPGLPGSADPCSPLCAMMLLFSVQCYTSPCSVHQPVHRGRMRNPLHHGGGADGEEVHGYGCRSQDHGRHRERTDRDSAPPGGHGEEVRRADQMSQRARYGGSSPGRRSWFWAQPVSSSGSADTCPTTLPAPWVSSGMDSRPGPEKGVETVTTFGRRPRLGGMRHLTIDRPKQSSSRNLRARPRCQATCSNGGSGDPDHRPPPVAVGLPATTGDPLHLRQRVSDPLLEQADPTRVAPESQRLPRSYQLPLPTPRPASFEPAATGQREASRDTRWQRRRCPRRIQRGSAARSAYRLSPTAITVIRDSDHRSRLPTADRQPA